MSAHGMKPTFKTQAGYKQWLKEWKEIYKSTCLHIRKCKQAVKTMQRANSSLAPEMQRQLVHERAMGAKVMTLLEEARIRWQNINDIHSGIRQQHENFPLEIEGARNIDFHFNKKHLEYPDIVPMWTLKAKGTSYYLHHIDCETPWTTRENPDHPSTKGSIRIKRGSISISEDGTARIY